MSMVQWLVLYTPTARSAVVNYVCGNSFEPLPLVAEKMESDARLALFFVQVHDKLATEHKLKQNDWQNLERHGFGNFWRIPNCRSIKLKSNVKSVAASATYGE